MHGCCGKDDDEERCGTRGEKRKRRDVGGFVVGGEQHGVVYVLFKEGEKNEKWEN